MSKNVAMISTINKRKVMLHKDFAKTFSLSNKKSYPIKIANQRMNSSQKQIKKINTTSSKDIKLPKTSRITLSKGNPLLNSGKKISFKENSRYKTPIIVSKSNEVNKSDSCIMNSKLTSYRMMNNTKPVKQSNYCNFVNNNITKTNDDTNASKTESNFLNYELGNDNQYSKLPEVSLHNYVINEPVEEKEYDLTSMYKKMRQLRSLNSFESSEQSIYYVNTNEFNKNEEIHPIYIEKYNNSNKWYYHNRKASTKQKGIMKLNTINYY